MVAAKLYGWPYVTAHSFRQLSDNYSDIGTIKIDAYINTRRLHRAQLQRYTVAN